MYTTVEDANQAFALMVEHAAADFDLDASECFYHYICGASDLLKKIREAAEKKEMELLERSTELTEQKEPRGTYL